MTDPLYEDPALARFYDLDNGWFDDTRYCLGLPKPGDRVLDLGCGTGLLAAAMAEKGCSVTGADPAAAMLEIARQRPGGTHVRWVEADARILRLGEAFDLVVMTGHAFQVFLTEADQLAVCRTIAAHLAPTGRFIFDSREPAREEWREWTPERTLHRLQHPELGPLDSWNDVSLDAATGIVTYGTFYKALLTGENWSARSRIRFTPRPVIARHLEKAGLTVDGWYGDWKGGPHRMDSAEIIAVGRLA